MLKKFVTLMMVFAIFTVSASASTHQGLKAAFDELNYGLNVEWDQKDKEFYRSEMKKFADSVSALQENGLTNEELVAFVKSEIKDKKVANDLEAAFNAAIVNKMSPMEARNHMVETMKKAAPQGASWNGSSALLYIGAAAFIVLVVVAVATAKPCQTNCGGGGYYYDPYYNDPFYYDPWYGYGYGYGYYYY